MLKAGVRSGCSIWSPAFFAANSRIKLLLWDVHTHFDRAGWPALVRCPCAFWLRRLAQNSCPSSGARHFSCKFSSCVYVHFNCAVSHKAVVALLGRSFFPVNSRVKLLMPCAFRSRGLAQLGCKILFGALSFMHFVWRSCGDPCEMLPEAFAWSCAGPCEKLLKRSWCMIWNRSLWEDLAGILLISSLRGPCMYVRSWRPFALVLVWNFFWHARRKFLHEDLVSSSE